MTANNTNPPSEKTWDDPIVAEVRKVRDAIAAEFDYDITGSFSTYQSAARSGAGGWGTPHSVLRERSSSDNRPGRGRPRDARGM